MGTEMQAIQPLEAIYKLLVEEREVEIEGSDSNSKYLGKVIGFDEYMNIVFQTNTERFIIKGDCIATISYCE